MYRAILLLLAILAVSEAHARTWRVWKDGSGDYTVIQDAVDVAAPGDTVLIGPGRYTESSDFQFDITESGETFVGIEKDDLTLMGVHRDSVVIGPWEPDFVGFLPKGIAMRSGMGTRLRIESLTVRNVREGMRLREVAWVTDCVADSCDIGIVGLFDAEIEVDSSRMTRCFSQGALFAGGVRTAVRDCEAVGNFMQGLNFIQSRGVEVSRCQISDSRGGVQFQQGSVGSVSHTTIVDTPEIAVICELGSTLDMSWTTAEGGEEGVLVSVSTFTGDHNRLASFTLHLMNVLGRSEVSLTHSDLLLGPARSILVQGSASGDPMMYLDLTNNWWGTTDPELIADRIWDHADDESINATVLFEPFRASTAPTERRSFSSLKALFDHRP